MPSLSVEFGVLCTACRATLGATVENGDVCVDPCHVCLREANGEGFSRGYNEGLYDAENK